MRRASPTSGQAGCVSSLRLKDEGKAALLSDLTKVCAVEQQTVVIVQGQLSAAVAPASAEAPSSCSSSASVGSSVIPAASLQQLQGLDSRILQPAHHDDLARFFGDIPVSHWGRTADARRLILSLFPEAHLDRTSVLWPPCMDAAAAAAGARQAAVLRVATDSSGRTGRRAAATRARP